MDKQILYVYMLVDPRNDKPFYVGRSFDPKRRYADHLHDGSKYEQKGELGLDFENKSAIIDDIMTYGILPTMIILDNCEVHFNMKSQIKTLDGYESFWAIWVEKQYGVEVFGKHMPNSRYDNLEYYIERCKYHISTSELPPWPRKMYTVSREQMEELLEDFRKRNGLTND